MSAYKSVDEYLQTQPAEVRTILQNIRNLVIKTVPAAVETISYQMPTFKLNDTYVLYFAAWKDHIGIYPTPEGVSALEAELKPYKKAKGSIQLPLDKPIPYDLIEKIVQVRVKQIQAN